MVVMVTGASGLLGRAIARSYAATGTELCLVGRNPQRLRQLYGGAARIVTWGPTASDFPAESLDGVSTVFHLMGEPVGGRWNKAKKARIVTTRVTSAQMLGHAMDGRAIRMVSASSFGIYPGRSGDIYDEETRIEGQGQTFVQSTLRAWENAALSAENGPAKVTVIRFGMICGPEGYPQKLRRLFRRAGGFIIGDGEQIVPVVDIDDAVGMMRWAADGQAGEGVINCVSPQLPTFRQVAEMIAANVGKPIRAAIPDWFVRPILGGSADFFLRSYDMRPSRALAQGFSFQHDEPEVILRRALTPY